MVSDFHLGFLSAAWIIEFCIQSRWKMRSWICIFSVPITSSRSFWMKEKNGWKLCSCHRVIRNLCSSFWGESLFYAATRQLIPKQMRGGKKSHQAAIFFYSIWDATACHTLQYSTREIVSVLVLREYDARQQFQRNLCDYSSRQSFLPSMRLDLRATITYMQSKTDTS